MTTAANPFFSIFSDPTRHFPAHDLFFTVCGLHVAMNLNRSEQLPRCTMPWAVSTCANRSSQLRNLRFRKFHFVMYMDDWDRLFSLQFFSRISRRIHSRVASACVISLSTARLTSFNFGIFCLVDYMIIRICRCVHWPSRPCSTIEDSFRESLISFRFWHGCSESFHLGCI